MGLSKASAALDIIRDVNRHAAVVLDGIDAAPSSDTGAVAAALAKSEQQKVDYADFAIPPQSGQGRRLPLRAHGGVSAWLACVARCPNAAVSR